MDDTTPQEEVVEAPVVEEKKDRDLEQLKKLANSNQELKEERDIAQAEAAALAEENEQYKKLYEAPTNVVPDANQYGNLNQQQIDNTFASMMDENGFLDGNKLARTLQELNARQIQAEERARKAEELASRTVNSLQDRTEREAQQQVYLKYPQLNPDNKEAFDPKMWRAVYNELAVKAKAGDNPTDRDYLDAADRVYSDFYAGNDMNKKEEAKKEEIVEAKQQINAVRPSSTAIAGYYKDEEEQDLIQKVQQGKRGALAEMLNRRGQ